MEIKIDFKNRTVCVSGHNVFELQEILMQTVNKYFPEQNISHTASELMVMKKNNGKDK